MQLFDATFFYIRSVSPVIKTDFMQMIESLPKEYETRVKTLYEQILEEGMEKGLQKGMEKGMEKGLATAIRKYMLAFPKESDANVSDLFEVSLPLVLAIRKDMASAQN